MSKVKIFLGAYLDVINAQNLNCRHIAKYLDKNKFKVYSLSINKQKKIKGITVDVRSKNCLYITIGDWVVYLDNSTNEKIVNTWNKKDGFTPVE